AADELTAGEKLAVESLIKQFQQRSFADRQKATEKLIELGPKVLPMVQQTLAETTDNEVKLRCRMVLDGIVKQYGVRVEEPQATGAMGTTTVAAGKLDFEPSKVTIDAKRALLDDILQQFADKSGNRLIGMPQNWQGGPIDFAVTDMPYWEALDKLCVQLKLTYTQDYRSGTLRLVPAGDRPEITAYAGPFVLKLASAMMFQSFRPVGGMGQREGLTYTVNCYWEDRMDVLEKEIDYAKAVAPDGAELKVNEQRGMGRLWTMGGMGGRRVPAATSTVYLTEVPQGLDKLARLEGVARITLGAGKEELKIEDALGEGERSVVDGEGLIKITRVVRNNFQGNNMVGISLTRTEDGKPTELDAYRDSDEYGFHLVDPNGGVHKASAGYGMTFQQGVAPGGVLNHGDQRNRQLRPKERGKVDAPAAAEAVVVMEGRAGGAVVTQAHGGGGEVRIEVRAAEDKEGVHRVVILNEGAGEKAGAAGGGNAKGGVAAKEGDANPAAPAPGQVQVQVGPGVGGVVNAWGARGGAYVNFQNLPEIDGKWTLVYTRPLKTVVKEFPFTLRDVPVP
ncbi:MAG TPA: hypothetical protein VMY39_09990, partial [Planctomycetota bacterium]|nr:hypothetical protein [Planctomycetota bacterium]